MSASEPRRPHFCTALIVEELEDGTHQLFAWLVFYSVVLNGYVVAPPGSITNYANVPRAFWSIFPRDGPWKWAAVLHDCAYRAALVTLMGQPMHLIKTLADLLFYEAMSTRDDIDPKTRELMYRLVRRFGGKPYGGLGSRGLMFGPLLDVWIALERGEPAERRPAREVPPPHLQGVEWIYVCDCGLGWRKTADAIWHQQGWWGPAIECVGCRTWVVGRI